MFKQVDMDVDSSIGGNSFVVQIRDIDNNGHPGNILKTLSGPTSPNGLASYVGHVVLNTNTSYFVVMGADILGAGFRYDVSLVNGSSADSGEDIYQFGTDTNSDGNADIKDVCTTTNRVNWDCSSPLSAAFYSKVRIFSDVLAVPRVLLSSTAINFGNVAIATDSFQVLTITNSGNSNLVLGSLSDDNLFTITVDNCSGRTLTPGNNCTATIRFTPTAQGAVNGHITIPSNAPSSPDIVAVSGTGLAPSLFLSSGHLSFGSQIVGTSTADQTITITDNGGAPLAVTSVTSNNAAFIISADTCTGNTVPIAGSCTFNAKFSPTAVGGISSTIRIITDAASSPDDISVDGTGIAPTVTLSSSTVHFGNVNVASTSDFVLMITNSGSSNLNLGALNSDQGVFTLPTDNCSGQTIAAGNNCTATIRFAPTAQGAINGHISVPSNTTTTPDTVAVSGVGDTPVAFLSSSHLSFGHQLVGVSTAKQTITLSDNGGAPLVVTSVASNNAAFIISADSCSGTTVNTGSNCSFDVAFTPAAIGAISSTIRIVTNAASSPDAISVDGVGDNIAIAVNPGFIDFGDQNINTSSVVQNVTLTNSGTTALTISNLTTSNQFSIVSGNCAGNTLNAAAICTLGVQFQPTHGGSISSTLMIFSNHPDQPHGIYIFGNSLGGSITLINSLISEIREIPVNSLFAILLTSFLIILVVYRNKKEYLGSV